MVTQQLIEGKVQRLEELRQYQAMYGPNTPYPVIVEINQLETELRQLLASPTRQTRVVKKKKKKKAAPQPFWHMSQPTFDIVATIAFIGLVFLLGSIIYAAYVQTRPQRVAAAPDLAPAFGTVMPTRRPTFTPTPGPGTVIVEANGAAQLPSANREATPVPTPVPTLTPSVTPTVTETPAPTATPEPSPTSPPPPPAPKPAAPAQPQPQPAAAAPAAPPPPEFPFMVAETGNRAFQSTNYHVITIYVAVVSEGNIPLGDYKVIADHVPSGQHIESAPSTWNWSVTNCLDCGWRKQGNVKMEPGTFSDGTWNIYLVDASGTKVSPVVPLTYSADPTQWVWDFVIFRRING